MYEFLPGYHHMHPKTFIAPCPNANANAAAVLIQLEYIYVFFVMFLRSDSEAIVHEEHV